MWIRLIPFSSKAYTMIDHDFIFNNREQFMEYLLNYELVFAYDIIIYPCKV